MITVAEINDIDRIDNFRLAWRSLLGKTKGVTFAHSPEFLEQYWEHFGEGLKLRTLMVTLGNKVIGIVPLVVKPVPTKMGTMRVLTYPLDGWGAFFSQIGQNPAATMVTAMRHLRNSKRDWDLIDLRYIDQDGLDRKRTANAFKSVGFQGSQAVWQQLPLVNTQETDWTSYLSSRSTDTQQQIFSAEQSISKTGRVAFYRSQLEDPLAPGWNPRWDLWTEFEQMEFSFGNQTTIAGGSFSNSRKLAFLRDLHGPAVRAGLARIDALFINHTLVACAYGLQHAHGTDYLALGRQKNASPEVITALIAHMIQQSILDGEPSLNLSLLGPEFASIWKNQDQKSYRCSHFPVTAPRSQVLRLNRWIQQPALKPSRTELVATTKPELKLSQTPDTDSSIEITAEAPPEWHSKQASSNDDVQRRFRVVG
ncbi:hypothetical protein Pan241w_21010 [Gimesia alba]|uniref:BioF2-like acetyltransferase domain-containing protein n=1 Tax=Gimesia alba TaxID=2527973 RepID=A0A517RDS4_9PLAN|nr:hypothetical protein [Gimesia alba]QDT42020.1 hypothetical protein Pan241w_21010 [Gimesia alba]